MNENITTEKVEYATFWKRAGAYILDAIFLILITGIINFVNISNYKSFALYLPFALIAVCYKPFMESYYGATIGKMILKLKVTNKNFEKIDMTTSILRSLILVFPAAMYIPIYYMAFNNPNLADLNGLMEFSKAMSSEYSIQGIIGNLSMILIIADIIFLLTDNTKKQRSLHDRIADTYVIVDKKE
ncbi:RDD family protein [uncultured Winogradskyella sp.]|uniref:RDD family protein n=1 Tax=uncultured Winogradskyella sp. TaxID=395353 RepID=UPI0030DD3282|tara:strand:+ start:54936 stop:55493 length:558 start_codon:yes stop_codon:yes gene_type:complete